MNKKLILSFAALLILSMTFTSCKEVSRKLNFLTKQFSDSRNRDTEDDDNDDEIVSLNKLRQVVMTDDRYADDSYESDIIDVINKWNRSLNLRDEVMSQEVYAPEVFFYIGVR